MNNITIYPDLLGKRYLYDGIPLLQLNELQQNTKQRIDKKIRDGEYSFERIFCCVCGSHEFRQISQKDRYGLQFSVVYCCTCGLIQTNPRMTQAAYNEFYNIEYRALYGGIHDPELLFKNQMRIGYRIFKLLNLKNYLPQAGSMVVEIGCGAGGILNYFKEKGYRVAGVDLDTSTLQYGRDNYDLNLVSGTLNTLCQMIDKADLVIYSHVLEHILDPLSEINQLKEIIDYDTKIYIEVPGIKNIHMKYQMDFLRYLQNAHVYHFCRRNLRHVLELAGYRELIGNEYIRGVYEIDNENQIDKSLTYDPNEGITYLKKLERMRTIVPITPQQIIEFPKSIRDTIFKNIIKTRDKINGK